MVHILPVTFYGLNFFVLKYSEQILGSDLFWGLRIEGVGLKKEEFLKLFPLGVVILLTHGLVTSFPPWIVELQGN